MQFLRNFFRAMSSQDPASDFWYEPANGSTAAGVRITHDNALQVTAVYSCVRVLSEAIASLPLVLYRRLPNGGKEEATDHPLYNLLKYQPNGFQTKFNFVQMLTGHLALRGNFYAQQIIGRNGQVEQLIPLHPGRMKTEILPNNTLRFRYTDNNGYEKVFLQGDLFRVHGLSSDGIKGMSVIEQARETFGGAFQTQEYANRFFGNDARPGGILQADAPMDAKVVQANKESWEKIHRGAKNAHKVAILYGLKWQSMGMTNEDCQFLETRKFTRSEICGLFGVPPHMIGDLERATFSNIEQQDIGLYKHTIRPHLVNIEQAIKRDLILEDDVFAEFNADGLLRGDALSRAQVYATALGAGGHQPYITVNEVRAKENLNPIEGGDVLPERAAQNSQNNQNNQTNGSKKPNG